MFPITIVEKNFLHKISAYSDVTEDVVKRVILSGILKSFVADFYKDNYTVFIPYIARLTFDCSEKFVKGCNKFVPNIKSVICESFIHNMLAIINGDKALNDPINLRLIPEEKVYIKKIMVNSGVDEKSVLRVLIGILKTFVTEYFCGNNIVYLPYICMVIIDFYEEPKEGGEVRFVVPLKITACQTLNDELYAITNGEKTQTLEYIKSDLVAKLEDMSEL